MANRLQNACLLQVVAMVTLSYTFKIGHIVEKINILLKAKYNLLNFYSIIGTLEKLKQEAAEITKKVEETDVVMAEVEAVTDQYRPLSQSCSSIYFTMESLNLVCES